MKCRIPKEKKKGVELYKATYGSKKKGHYNELEQKFEACLLERVRERPLGGDRKAKTIEGDG